MNSTASKQAATNPRFIVGWHYAADGQVIGYQRCQFATKKAASRTLARLVKYHPDWNIFMGAV